MPQPGRSVTGGRVNTERLGTDDTAIARAADLLRAGQLVAFPTETVYGLGADATSDSAVAGVFDAKGRPSFNPLIVHVSDIEMAEHYGRLPELARDLVETVWPGPLSIVVPLRDGTDLSPLVTAGQASVALRMPSGVVASRLIAKLGGPIAAPSANPSGRISPTSAEHVVSGLDGRIAALIDGGTCPAGLESTIIGFLEDTPSLLREGAYVADLPGLTRHGPTGDTPLAPGQLASHYAPEGTLRLNAKMAEPEEFHIGFGPIPGDINLSKTGDLVEAAARLYAALHEANARRAARIAVAPIPDTGLGRAINDRLRRAAAPRP